MFIAVLERPSAAARFLERAIVRNGGWRGDDGAEPRVSRKDLTIAVGVDVDMVDTPRVQPCDGAEGVSHMHGCHVARARFKFHSVVFHVPASVARRVAPGDDGGGMHGDDGIQVFHSRA